MQLIDKKAKEALINTLQNENMEKVIYDMVPKSRTLIKTFTSYQHLVREARIIEKSMRQEEIIANKQIIKPRQRSQRKNREILWRSKN